MKKYLLNKLIFIFTKNEPFICCEQCLITVRVPNIIKIVENENCLPGTIGINAHRCSSYMPMHPLRLVGYGFQNFVELQCHCHRNLHMHTLRLVGSGFQYFVGLHFHCKLCMHFGYLNLDFFFDKKID